MLPPEILDQITFLNSQHRELLSIINQLSQPTITSQSALDELAGKIKNGFAEADRAIQNLEASIDTDDDPSAKDEGGIYLAKIIEDMKLARTSFRKLLLQASKTMNQTRHAQAREALFQRQTQSQPQEPTSKSATLRRRRASPARTQDDSSLLASANDVTLALKRTHALLEQELEKSTFSLETLDHSSQTLRQLEHHYSAFDVLLRGSKRLITDLERADKWDRWMIYGGLLVFGMMCLWIVYKRIIRGPLGLVLWAAGKAVGSRKTASSVVGKGVLSSTTPAKVEVTTTASVETSYERVEGDDKPLWSEGFDLEDVITEYVTVTVDVDEETAVPEAGRHVEL